MSQCDDEQKQWADDLITAADLAERLCASITGLRDEARRAERILPEEIDMNRAVRIACGGIADRLDAILVNSHKEPAP